MANIIRQKAHSQKKQAEAIQPAGDITLTLPTYKGTMGPNVMDVQALYKNHNIFTYDPGFMSTGSCQSAITFIDGDIGQLLYRGYAIDDLAENCTFMEVCYLLMNGELPNTAELDAFTHIVTQHTMVHEQVRTFYQGFRRDAHPMAILCGSTGALAGFYHDSLDINDPKHREISAIRLIAKMPTLTAMAYKYSIGQPFIYPDNSLSFAGNFLKMMFAVPAEDYKVNPVVERAMDLIFTLHADHEQNASTSTVRLAGSSGANPFTCISAGIASLWGPAHGGANEAVLDMLAEISSMENIPAYIEKVKDKANPTRLMGFGHRVYKNFDPRATLMRKTCHEVLGDLGINDPMLDIAMELERIALEDPYFVDRKLYPNVDFYSGIILRAIGIPTNMFTCIFALSRTVGWISHWMEMIAEPTQKIGRPRQLYTGATERKVTPLKKRK